MLSYPAFVAGGAGGIRTRGLCSAIEKAPRKKRAIRAALRLQQSRNLWRERRSLSEKSRSLAGREIWRSIPSACGIYEASSLGRIRRADGGRILNGSWRPDGYRQVDLSIDGKRRTAHVRALVCEAFHGMRPEGMQAAHLDGDVANDRPDNLEWATPAENANHRWRHGTMISGEDVSHAVLTESDVIEIRRRFADGEKPLSIAKDYPVGWWHIYRIVHRKRWAWLADEAGGA